MCKIDSLILLIGSNPLPNYIATMVLKPDKLILIHSKETKEIANALIGNLNDKGFGGLSKKIPLTDAYNPQKIGISIKKLIEDEKNNASTVHLNYTGGTKVMAGQALRAFYSVFGDDAPHNASYLNEKEEKIIFDSGKEMSLAEYELNIDLNLLIKLHGFKKITDEKENEYYSHELAKYLIKKPALCTPLYELFTETRNNKGKAIIKKTDKENNDKSKIYFEDILQKYGYGNDISKIFGDDVLNSFKSMESWQHFVKSDSEINISIEELNSLSKDQRRKIAKLLTGDWLEIFVKYHFQKAIEMAIHSSVKPNIYQGIHFTAENEMETEVDLTVLNRHRLFQISCTSSTDVAMSKSKLFEISVRAKQLGGDLARFAILSLIDNKGLQKIEKQLETSFSSHSQIGYFGLEDLEKLCDNELSDKEKYRKIWKFLDLDR